MNLKIILINGKPRAGKDTFVEKFKEVLAETPQNNNIHEREIVYNTSTIDYVKEIAKQFGWDEDKTPEARRFLCELKDSWTRYNNGPFNQIVEYINRIEKYHPQTFGYVYVFIHVREIAEIQKLKEHCGEHAITLLITGREETNETGITNHADANTDMGKYQHIINNSGTLEDLKAQAILFHKTIKRAIYE